MASLSVSLSVFSLLFEDLMLLSFRRSKMLRIYSLDVSPIPLEYILGLFSFFVHYTFINSIGLQDRLISFFFNYSRHQNYYSFFWYFLISPRKYWNFTYSFIAVLSSSIHFKCRYWLVTSSIFPVFFS